MDNQILVTNIQRFSLHDGPGIRTTVFLKGCSLHCPWCANPENIRPIIETFEKDGEKGEYGRYYTREELYAELIKDRLFYTQTGKDEVLGNLPGGITFSGGEPLLQFASLESLLQRLTKEKIYLCVESCLFVPEDQMKIALKYIDLFYVDVKILQAEKCRAVLGGDLTIFLRNVEALFVSGKPVVFRMPVIGGYTDGEKNIAAAMDFLKRYRPLKVELIKEHNLGRNKYVSLGRLPLDLNSVTDREMDELKEKIEGDCQIVAEVCKV